MAARHPESPVFRAAIVGLLLFALAAAIGTTLAVLVIVKPAPASSSSSPAKPKPIAAMTMDELLTNLGEDALGPIDCSKALTAAGLNVQGQLLTGLVWQQADQGRLVVVCAPS